MTNILQDKATVDTNSYVLDILMQSDMAKAFPQTALSLSRRCNENMESRKNHDSTRGGQNY